MKKYIKEIGVISSYIFLLIGILLFEWKPFGIFLSFLIEFVALTVIYTVVRSIDQYKNPKKYRKLQPSITIAIAVIPLIAVQYLFISLVVSILDPIFVLFEPSNLWEQKELTFGFIAILLFYVLKTTQMKSIEDAEKLYSSNFFVEALTLNFTNILGVIIVAYVQINSLPFVLIMMVALRIFLELKLSRFFVAK